MPLIEKKYVEVRDNLIIEFRVKRHIERLSMDMDLSVASVENAMIEFREGVGIQSGTLIVSEALALIAGSIREEFAKLTDIGLSVIVLPDALFSDRDTWALMNENHQVIWSPGA